MSWLSAYALAPRAARASGGASCMAQVSLLGIIAAFAAVSAVVDIMQRERLEENAVRIGALMKSRLLEMQEKSPYVGEVRGMGLVMGVELVKDKKTKEPAADLTRKLIDLAAELGLLIGSVGVFGNVIRVAPPLVISEDEANESLDIFERALSRLS